MVALPPSAPAAGFRLPAGWTTAFCLGVLSGLAWFAYLPTFQNPVNLYDEGLILAGADRLLRGDVMYRDIFSMYGPIPYWLTAAGFAAWEPSIAVWRAIVAASELLLAVLGFVAARRFVPWPVALLCGVTFVFFRSSAWGLVLPLLGLLLATGSGRPAVRLLAAGVVIGLGVWIKHEVAVFAAVAVVIWLLAEARLEVDLPRLALRRGAWFSAGLLAGGLPLLLWLTLLGALPFLVPDLLVAASRQINAVALPWPQLGGAFETGLPADMAVSRLLTVLQFWLPFVLLPFGAWYAVAARVRGWVPGFRWQFAFVLAVFGILLLNSQLVRSDDSHVLFASVPTRILAFGLVWWTVLEIRRRRDVVLATVTGLLALALTGHIVLSTAFQLLALDGVSRAQLLLPAVGLSRLPVHEGPTNAVLFNAVSSDAALLLAPEATLLVLPGSQPVMQFLADRRSPTRYDWTIEGVLTPADRDAMLQQLERSPPDLVLLLSAEGGTWPVLRARLHAFDSEPVLDWVLARYVVISQGAQSTLLAPRGR